MSTRESEFVALEKRMLKKALPQYFLSARRHVTSIRRTDELGPSQFLRICAIDTHERQVTWTMDLFLAD